MRIAPRVRPAALWPIALLCAIATVWGLLHVWVRLQLISAGYEISHETQLRHDLTELTQRLSLELRTRMDLGTIERIARDQLQMVPPDPQQIRPITLAPLAPDGRGRASGSGLAPLTPDGRGRAPGSGLAPLAPDGRGRAAGSGLAPLAPDGRGRAPGSGLAPLAPDGRGRAAGSGLVQP